MSELGYGAPFEGLDSDVLDSMANFDEEQHMLHSLLTSIFKEKPEYEQYSDTLAEQITHQATHFANLSIEVFGFLAGSADEAKTGITRLWVADDNKRGELFNKLVGVEYYDMFDEPKVAKFVANIFENAESVQELGELIYANYTSSLCADVDSFIDISSKMPPEGVKRFQWQFDVDVESAKASLRNTAIAGAGLALGGMLMKAILKSREH